MPAIDLARLRKQTTRLADFFFLPDEFQKYLGEILDFYVNHTLRTAQNVAPLSNLPTYRTPPLVLRAIQNELAPLANQNPSTALELADRLWDMGYLEPRLLAAFLLGQIPPQEERLLARLTAWTGQIRDPSVRAALLTTSLARLRKETPHQFFELISEWLHPSRQRTWSNGIQALLPLLSDPNFDNLPVVFTLVEPILKAAPTTLQNDLQELIVSLYRASPNETIYFLQQILQNTTHPMAAITLRRILPSFPAGLQSELRPLLRTPTKGG
ncbi:MAG: DNA alkylation repair protein [Anaerolineae bacterium]